MWEAVIALMGGVIVALLGVLISDIRGLREDIKGKLDSESCLAHRSQCSKHSDSSFREIREALSVLQETSSRRGDKVWDALHRHRHTPDGGEVIRCE
jgi:hypothetical protein